MSTFCASNFNPRSPCGERRGLHSNGEGQTHFNPRSPCGERLHGRLVADPETNFNPRSPCGERRVAPYEYVYSFRFQSTLSLRRATEITVAPPITYGFQSTLSLRRATDDFPVEYPVDEISIHALLAESDACFSGRLMLELISIHALLAESDAANRFGRERTLEFQSTLSLRRATRVPRLPPLWQPVISIHALLAESDPRSLLDKPDKE